MMRDRHAAPGDLPARIGRLAHAHGVRVGGAESVTAGRVAASLAAGPSASDWFMGAVVAYQTAVKHSVLDVPPGPVVSRSCALHMAHSARRLLGCDLAYATTGAGGPTPVEGQPPGTVWIAVLSDGRAVARCHHIGGDPAHVVQTSVDLTLRAIATMLGGHRT